MCGLVCPDSELPLVIKSVVTRESMRTRKVEARLAQELQLEHTDCVLEIGTGSGYQAALLARLSQQVTSIEVDSRLACFAVENLQRNQVGNVSVETGDAHAGWGTTEYDAILITGSVPNVPDALRTERRREGKEWVGTGRTR